MKTLEQCGGKLRSWHYKPNDYTGQKYWGSRPKPFLREDGSVGVDKTRGFHSRPGAKETIRNAARGQVKRGRQLLKRAMLAELDTLD